MLRRIIAAVLCIGVLCAGAVATADAASRKYKAGSYRGQTEQGATIRLKVLKSKRALVKFYWEGARMQCSDGEDRTIQGAESPADIKIPIKKSGRFRTGGSSQDESINFAIEGRLRGKRAVGALQVQARAENEDGSVLSCDSEIVEWSARKR
jgi:hypothetical protein